MGSIDFDDARLQNRAVHVIGASTGKFIHRKEQQQPNKIVKKEEEEEEVSRIQWLVDIIKVDRVQKHCIEVELFEIENIKQCAANAIRCD